MTGKYSLGRLRDKLLTHKKYLVCHLPLLQVTFHGCDRGRPEPARRRPTCTLLGDEEFLVAMGAFIMKTDKMNLKSQDDQSKRVCGRSFKHWMTPVTLNLTRKMCL